jgi:hypothetical protein
METALVFFETAKLLKQHGYVKYVTEGYDENGHIIYLNGYKYPAKSDKFVAPAITTKEAIAWIQEKFGITIRVGWKEIEYINEHEQLDTMYKWRYEISNSCSSDYEYNLKWDAEDAAIVKVLESL